jgi:hypothetical protein
MPHARAPPPARPGRGEAGRQPACVLGRDGKGFTTSFLMRRDPISAEALQLLAIKC